MWGKTHRNPDQHEDLPDENPAESPTQLPRRSWLRVLRGSAREFSEDNLSDSAASLTYYGIQALFPGILVLVSLLGFLSDDAIQELKDNLGEVVPGTFQSTINSILDQVGNKPGSAGFAFVLGLVTALWSSSGYIAAFMRASNVVYDIPEGRPIWKTLPTRVLTTLVMLVLILMAAVIVLFTGPLAQQAGDLLGLGDAAVTTWSIVKWPVLLLIMMLELAILYWAAPNAKQGFRWVTPGGILAVVLWLVASAGFGFYVANFSSYDATYGTFAGIVIFLIWMWISNLAILLGAEFNAELERARAENDGLPRGAEPYVRLRDTRKLDDDELAEVEGSRRHLRPDRGGDSGSV
ncbi:YihY/virulence factor BrkB family protein [Kineosporia sp. J2-2]|uniref:YihY/virulence factor BrkB family protein n=1 Tax=Kineosporia corallincola TaxID=2835133 RepID=A0ABS5TEW7_9ACTN|nr:YihY/virulence factor BrkB family protein [Kineosporia corallincola]MBT0769607.1 YihY/virulence factor BrkB family protein [Kineosporia corallincola]